MFRLFYPSPVELTKNKEKLHRRERENGSWYQWFNVIVGSVLLGRFTLPPLTKDNSKFADNSVLC